MLHATKCTRQDVPVFSMGKCNEWSSTLTWTLYVYQRLNKVTLHCRLHVFVSSFGTYYKAGYSYAQAHISIHTRLVICAKYSGNMFSFLHLAHIAKRVTVLHRHSVQMACVLPMEGWSCDLACVSSLLCVWSHGIVHRPKCARTHTHTNAGQSAAGQCLCSQ